MTGQEFIFSPSMYLDNDRVSQRERRTRSSLDEFIFMLVFVGDRRAFVGGLCSIRTRKSIKVSNWGKLHFMRLNNLGNRKA